MQGGCYPRDRCQAPISRLAPESLYDTDTGRLYYDADGAAAGSKPQLIATIGGTTHPLLGVQDFTIYL